MRNRNRVIYQSEALFVSPDATGYHFTGVNGEGMHTGYEGGQYTGQNISQREQSVLRQFSRVQSANYSFSISRTDINQYGQLGRIDSMVLDAPTVSLDFSYFLTNGENERLLGFNVNGKDSCISGRILADESQGQNFFILTTPEGTDAIGNQLSASDEDNMGVISLGNGFISDYSVDLSVGSLPTANVTIEGFNIKSDQKTTGLNIPAVDPFNGTKLPGEKLFAIPYAKSHNATGAEGDSESALKPGDIVLQLNDPALLSSQLGNTDGLTSAHIQSCSISIPLSRTSLQRLGSNFGYTKVVDFPVTATCSISALVADLKEGNLIDRIYEEEESGPRKGLAKAHDLIITLRNPTASAATSVSSPTNAMVFTLKNAVLESESFGSSIGDNKSVDLQFTTQIAGPQDLNNGVFISGEVANNPNHFGKPPSFINISKSNDVTHNGKNIWVAGNDTFLSGNVGFGGETNYGPQ